MSFVTAPDPSLRVASHGRRPASFLFSAAVHGALLCAVAFGPRPAPRVKRPIYESIIRPNEKKIIWYRKVPEIVPTVKVGDSKDPQGNIKSATTTIALSPKPKSSQQLILQPDPKITLEQDVPAPNLVAIAAPLPPAPAPKSVKRFVAPPAPPKPKVPVPVLEEPDVKVTWTEEGGAERSVSFMRPKRTFIAPPQAKPTTSAPRLTLESAPEVGSGGAGGAGGAAQVANLSGYGMPGRPAPKRFIPLAGAKPSGGGGGGGTGGDGVALDVPPPELSGGSGVSAAIVGLRPTDKLIGSIPSGNRPAEFSAAPKVGKTATGDINGGGAVVPGLVVKGGKDERVKSDAPAANPVTPGSRTVRYDDLVSDSVRPALSAPLRPSSRTIPRALEARFQGRFVYTIVIPVPNLPAYSSDWIVWFAEQGQKPGDVPRMRAPVPLQKTESTAAGQAPSGNGSEARIQLAAVIKANGHVDAVTVVKGPATAASQSAIEDLKRWEFRPAMRDGAPIDVEVVIEIPFRSAWLSL